jgi:ribosomal protein L22
MSDEPDKQAEAEAEEKPKRRRPRAKAAEGGEAASKRQTRAKKPAAAPEAEAAADAPAEAAAEEAPAAEAKPKRRRAAKPKAEKAAPAAASAEAETTAEAEPEPAATEEAPPPKAKPKPRRGAVEPGAAPPVVRARARYVRSSARKARLVCDHIRGKSVEEARAILQFAPRAVAQDWSKLLESAIANAEHNHELVGEDLRIQEAYADEGPTLKRFRPRAMGRATRIRKRTAHLTIALTPRNGAGGAREGRR